MSDLKSVLCDTCCWHQNMRAPTGFQTIKIPCNQCGLDGLCHSKACSNLSVPQTCNMPLAFETKDQKSACPNDQAWVIIGMAKSRRYSPLIQYGANIATYTPLQSTGCCRQQPSQAGEKGVVGCKCNRCRPDAFYFPHTYVARATQRDFYLLARPIVLPVLQKDAPCFEKMYCASTILKFEYAVSALPDCTKIIPLASEPRQIPGQCATTTDFYDSAFLQLVSGESIYIPGQNGAFDVELFADATAGPYRANASVMRGYSPVRRLQGRVFTSNSGLRNFNIEPLIRPW